MDLMLRITHRRIFISFVTSGDNEFVSSISSLKLAGWLVEPPENPFYFFCIIFIFNLLPLVEWVGCPQTFRFGIFALFKHFQSLRRRSLFGIFTNHLCGRLKHLRQFTFTTECLFTSWSFNYIIWEPPSPSPSPSSSPSPSPSSSSLPSSSSSSSAAAAAAAGGGRR